MSWGRWLYWLIGGGIIGGALGAIVMIALSAISNGPCAAHNPYIPWWVGSLICPPLVFFHDLLILPVSLVAFFAPFAAKTALVNFIDTLAIKLWSVVGALAGALIGGIVSYIKLTKYHSSSSR